MKRFLSFFAAAVILLGISVTTRAQSFELDDNQEIEVSADRLEYDAERKLLIGTGNVDVSQGNSRLKADFVTVHTVSEEVYAAGNVRFEGEGRTWEGEELTYNFKTEQGDFGEFSAYVNPLYIRATDSQRTVDNQFEINDVFISSCEGEEPEFYITAEKASIENDRYVRAENAVFRLGGVPIFWVPYYKYDLQRGSHWDFLPGYRSKWGAFLLTTYNTRVNDWMHSRTHLDLRSERGAALGQDFLWANKKMRGEVRGYYAHDSKPYYKNDDLTEKEKDLIDTDRYRIFLEHMQDITEEDYLIANIDYVSDPEFMNDFFTTEYEDAVQPENYVSLTHVDDKYIAGLLINKRLNDFYENVNRIPEATLDFRRQQIVDSGFYYEGNNSAVFLEKEFPDQTDQDKYSTFRFDTRHMFYYPMRFFDFVNVTPRGGYEGTYYNKTKITEYSQQTVAIVTTNTQGETETTFSNKTITTISDGSSKWRNLPELGADISYQAFKILEPAGAREGGLRHVAEPYTLYTFVPEPSTRPSDLYQFDEIDELDKKNVVTLGMRNKLQTKRSGSVANLVDLDIFIDYNFAAEDEEEGEGGGEEKIGSLGFYCESYPIEPLTIKFDGHLGTHGESFTNFNGRIIYDTLDVGELGIEYRYQVGVNDQFTLYADLFPEETWSLGGYWRYQISGAVMEEQTYYLAHRTDCLGYKFGYTGRGDDWDVWFQIWLTAFPDSQLNTAVSY